MRQTYDLTVASLKMLLRDRAALLTAAIFPVLFLLVFSLYDLSITPSGGFGAGSGAAGSLDYFDFVLPGMLALGLMNFTMVGMAGSVARYRETKVLRRLTAAPVSPTAFIAGQVLARVVVSVGQVALLLSLGVALGGTVVGNPLWLFVLALLGNLTFLAFGFALAGRAPSVDAANNLAGLATMPLMFLSGMFFPLDSLPAGIRAVADLLPITPLVEGMRAVALEGVGPAALGSELLQLGVWAVVSFVLARFAFRMADTGPVARRRRATGRQAGSVGEHAAVPAYAGVPEQDVTTEVA